MSAASAESDQMSARDAAMMIWSTIRVAQGFVWTKPIGPHECKVYESFSLDTFRSYLMYLSRGS